jgi:hypothetical protein
LEQDVGFGTHDEEGRAEREDVKPLEIDVAVVDPIFWTKKDPFLR